MAKKVAVKKASVEKGDNTPLKDIPVNSDFSHKIKSYLDKAD